MSTRSERARTGYHIEDEENGGYWQLTPDGWVFYRVDESGAARQVGEPIPDTGGPDDAGQFGANGTGNYSYEQQPDGTYAVVRTMPNGERQVVQSGIRDEETARARAQDSNVNEGQIGRSRYETEQTQLAEREAERRRTETGEAREAAGADDAEQQAERMDAGGDRYAGMGRDPYGGRQGGDYSGGYGGGGGGVGGGGGGGGVDQWQYDVEGIPFVDNWSGAQGARDRADAASEAARAEGYWHLLGLDEPTADELAVDYEAAADYHATGRSQLGDTYADEQDIEAQRDALRAMQDIYRSGGMTEADRARSRMAQDEVGRWMRSQREADDAALQARGMGGSGASIASMLSAQQGGASALAQRDAEMLQDAQARELQAMQAAGGLASGMREQGFSEGATRGSAVDDFNRWSAESRSGATNQTRESRSTARQQVYSNRERRVQGLSNRQLANDSTRQQDAARQQEEERRKEEQAAGLIEGLANL